MPLPDCTPRLPLRVAVPPLPAYAAHVAPRAPPQVVSGLIMGVFRPSLPPTVPTPERYLAGIKATRSDVLFCVPSFVEVGLRLRF